MCIYMIMYKYIYTYINTHAPSGKRLDINSNSKLSVAVVAGISFRNGARMMDVSVVDFLDYGLYFREGPVDVESRDVVLQNVCVFV